MGVSEQVVMAANEFVDISESMTYVIAYAAQLVAMPFPEFYQRRRALTKMAFDYNPNNPLYAMFGDDPVETLHAEAELTQKQWADCLNSLLTAYGMYATMYVKTWPAVSIVEAAVELAGMRASGEMSSLN